MVAGSLMYNALIDYWTLTGDDQYNSIIKQGMLSQIGSDGDFMPANQTSYETSSEQASWALAAMNAAEAGFLTDDGSNSSWVMLAEKVFSEQAARWDTKACNGGLKDGIFPFQTSYRTKGAFSNGLFMQLAARLAVYTGNSSYNEWPEKVWKWSESTGLVDSNYSIYNMLDTESGCDINDPTMWTAEFGAYLSTAAIQYNPTSGSSIWKSRLDGVLSRATEVFFNIDPDVMVGTGCEFVQSCNEEIGIYRSVLARALGDIATFAPYLKASVTPKIQNAKDTFCNFSWMSSRNTAFTGLGQQISALQIVLANLDRPQLATANQTGSGDGSESTGSSSTSTSAPSSTQSTATPTASGDTGAGNRLVGSVCGVFAGVVAALFLPL
ncbi:uncharacterized protein TRUGW13939_02981 [Talaromyces rugulosus]|uniref:mannan endo-1,6-alpha-mannosidase n=1 Tax=Talaromyces rugulosus TaxID=121627 RepID=A0A7H8QPQ2_TALRU|nr:uncharacterized protein TRUGW13939_02981 [Talaromyces rugulosus]QKX55882.1 hypothetical protein TRUGW13939_02981 [Talaromyces rugulosus]